MDPQRAAILREFGLSEYATRAYLWLLSMGDAEAREVSRAARIPLAKVYHVMDGLQERGLCEIVLGTPKRFVAVPFSDYLARVRREQERAIEALDRRRPEFEAAFTAPPVAKLSDRGRVQLVTGRSAVQELEARLMDRAVGSVILCCTPGRVRRMRKVGSPFERAVARGVRFHVLAPPTSTWVEDRDYYAGFAEVRVRAHEEDPRSDGVAFVVADRSEAMVVDAIPDDAHLTRGHDVATHVTQAGLVSALRDLLGAQWASAPLEPPRDARVRLPHG